MTSRSLLALTLAAVALLAAAVPARAALPTDDATKHWHDADACMTDATKQVPDHNEAALRKRDALVDACRKAHGLPPRAGLAPSPDANPPAANPPDAPKPN